MTYKVDTAGSYRILQNGYGGGSTTLSNDIQRIVINGVEQDLTGRPLNYNLQAGDNEVYVYLGTLTTTPRTYYFLNDCNMVTTLTIPPQCTSVLGQTCRGFNKRNEYIIINCLATTPPAIYNLSFYGSYCDELHVPRGYKQAYIDYEESGVQRWLVVAKNDPNNIIDDL